MNDAAALLHLLGPAIDDARVLTAIGSVPRDRFVGGAERRRAYEDVALPIACGQTISQPRVVARMLQVLALAPTDRVLDVGTGSGYHAALLALLAGEVWTIERHAELSAQARLTILGLEACRGCKISFIVGDGGGGLPDRAPFDAINVAAATGERVPAALERQLAVGGRLVAPVGDREQHLTLTTRTAAGLERAKLGAVRFVPLIRDL
ncbi:MAG: protein-L-isoaspartate(D-aspartate) O-methyltransferase [Solirubrobacteraceae bacterium]